MKRGPRDGKKSDKPGTVPRPRREGGASSSPPLIPPGTPRKPNPHPAKGKPAGKTPLPAVLFEADPVAVAAPPPLLTRPEPLGKPVAARFTPAASKPGSDYRPPLIPLGAAPIPPAPPTSSKTPLPPVAVKPEGVILRLVARDPRCVFAFWEVPAESVGHFAEAAAAGRLQLRLRSLESPDLVLHGEPLIPDGRSRFVEVAAGVSECVAELSWSDADGHWRLLAESAPVRLPVRRPMPTPVTDDAATIQGGTGVPPVSGERGTPPPPLPGTDADDPLADKPKPASTPSISRDGQAGDRRDADPTLAEAVALAMGLGIPPVGAGPGGSAAASSGELLVSSAEGAAPGETGFWFNVNAELIVHGTTAPDARFTVDGQPVALRPDGTFTLRFALPDGDCRLELQAAAADGCEERTARLRFNRHTRTGGRVGGQPESEPLPPTPPGRP